MEKKLASMNAWQITVTEKYIGEFGQIWAESLFWCASEAYQKIMVR